MSAYIARRLFFTIPTIFGIMLITFLLFNVIGGDVTDEYAGKFADKQTRDEIRSRLGLDKPLFFSRDSQFLEHLKRDVTFNFGRARDRQKISEKILNHVGYSLALTIPMLLGTALISICLALMAAYRRSGILDCLVVLFCIAAMSVPFLSFILFGQYFLAYKWGLFPVYFWPDLNPVSYLTLPILIGIVAGLGPNIRFYRSIFLEEFTKDYVRTAFAKGLSPAKVLFTHVLKNAMVPIITRIVFSIPYLFLGSLLLERFFGIPGLGHLIVDAVSSRDYQLLNAVVYISAVLIAVFTLIADMCYLIVDPRISLEKSY
jgi:peptide/nickel transport system permease protein